jgi:cysteine desulfurase
MKNPIYFDNSATTKMHPKVLEKMLPFLNEYYGNPSSIHSFGRQTRVAIEEARETIAGLINADAGEIYFTSSATEANNFGIFGIAYTEMNESGKNKIVTYSSEHKSVLSPVEQLGKSGFSILLSESSADAAAIPENISKETDCNTSLVSIMSVNNETGAINDLPALAKSAHVKGAYFHTDAVQAFGKLKIDVKETNIDCMSFTSHKLHGPKGIAAMYAKSGLPLSPLIHGGGQERNRRGGTESPAAIIGFAEAAKIANGNIESNYLHVSELKNHFTAGLNLIDPVGICINGGNKSLPYIASITFNGDHYRTDSEAMLMYLDINGIAVSGGAACSSGTLKPSHVILSCGKSEEDAKGTIRFSFSSFNTIEEVDIALDILKAMSKKFRK